MKHLGGEMSQSRSHHIIPLQHTTGKSEYPYVISFYICLYFWSGFGSDLLILCFVDLYVVYIHKRLLPACMCTMYITHTYNVDLQIAQITLKNADILTGKVRCNKTKWYDTEESRLPLTQEKSKTEMVI